MLRQIHFFALKEDILPVLEVVEAQGALKYVLTGNFTKPGLEVYSCGAELPDLGRPTSGSATGCASFLVTGSATPVNVRPIEASDGTTRYCVDQLINSDVVGFSSGGLWSEDIVLPGRVSTVWDSDASQGLMKRFKAALRKRFTRVQAFLVGPAALKLLDAGKRLTSGAQCPREYDLRR
ncbi:MAG TPA: hypothetical protein PK280_13260 [Planctomycetota bacterium]|nr:hypothetical protein [Planctomycetota bacterium]